MEDHLSNRKWQYLKDGMISNDLIFNRNKTISYKGTSGTWRLEDKNTLTIQQERSWYRF